MSNPKSETGDPGDSGGTEDLVQSLWQTARRTWNGVEVGIDVFRAFLATKQQDENVFDPEDPSLTHSVDLYLALACARGDANACRALEAGFLRNSKRWIHRMRLSDDEADEMIQLAREKLLVAKDGGDPRISQFSGKGPLGAWIRMVVVRIVLDEIGRRNQGTEMLAGLARETEEMDDAELGELRRKHAPDFKKAFEAALSEMTIEDRNLLRMHFFDGSSIDALALTFGIHRATAARRVLRAKAELFQRTREHLATRLNLGLTEAESLLRDVIPAADLSLNRIFRVDEPSKSGDA